MRRVIGMLVAALVMMASALPAGAQPGAGAGFEQGAMAAWVDMNGNTGTFIAADGFTFADDGGVHTLGGVAKGTCERVKTKGWVITTCTASGRLKEVGIDGFQMDPALQSASLEVKQAGQTHNVDWTGEEPMFGQGSGVGPYGAGAAVYGDSWSRAKGTIYGEKMGKGCWFCLLYEGAGAVVYTSFQKRLEVTTEDGMLRVKLQTWKRR